MNGARILAWFFFLVWAVWLFALEAWIGDGARWVPDLGLVLGLSLLSRAELGDAPLIALLSTLARSPFGAEPPIVVFTGFFAVLFLALLLRSVIELTAPLSRALVAGALVLIFDAWLALAHGVRLPIGVRSAALAPLAAWPTAVASGLAALVLGRALAHLPGLTPLRSRRW